LSNWGDSREDCLIAVIYLWGRRGKDGRRDGGEGREGIRSKEEERVTWWEVRLGR